MCKNELYYIFNFIIIKYIMNITEYLRSKGYNIFEGYSQQVPNQVEDLISLTNNNNKNINIMEIGFNAGHSAEVFLKNNDNLTLTSFDLGEHNYVLVAKEYIDKVYPGRHNLILGDSRTTIIQYFNENPQIKYDFIFIDGGHEYDIAKSDIDNCKNFAHENTIIALDDTVFIKDWEASYTIGPTKAWIENINTNSIIEIERKHYSHGRGMVWGKYIFNKK